MLNGEVINENILHGEIQREIISLLKKEEEITITPSVEDKVYTPTENKVFSKVTASGVTSSIDENIKPENIKLGVTILGIEGNVAQDKPDQEKTIYPSEEEQIVVADTGFELGKVIAKPVETESFEITPSEEEQIVKATDGKYIKEVVVGAVENIEEGLTKQETLLEDLKAQVDELSERDNSKINIEMYKYQDMTRVSNSGGAIATDEEYEQAENYLQGMYALLIGG